MSTGQRYASDCSADVTSHKRLIDPSFSQYSLAQMPRTLGDLDKWLRHRLRAPHLKQWRLGRVIYRELQVRGMSAADARTLAANSFSNRPVRDPHAGWWGRARR